jgi:hypothetical protein
MSEQHAALAAAIVDADDPIVRYKARRYLDGADPASATLQTLRGHIAASPIARGLLADLEASDPTDRQGMSTIYLTFRYLADIDYPPGDDRLVPYRDHVYRWLRLLEGAYDGPLFIRGTHRPRLVPCQRDLCVGGAGPGGRRHRRAVRQPPPVPVARRRMELHKKPTTKGPTIVHTAFGLRGLATYRERRTTPELAAAIEAAAQVPLDRRVYLKRSTGQPLRPVYTKLSYPYPRLYDAMAGLHILTRAGFVTDERCTKRSTCWSPSSSRARAGQWSESCSPTRRARTASRTPRGSRPASVGPTSC